MLCEMQSVSSKIWTRVAVFISNDDNHYTTGTSSFCYITISYSSWSLKIILNIPENILCITLNCIGWWGSSSRTLGSMKYLFVAVTPNLTLTRSGSSYKSPVYGWNYFIWKVSVLDSSAWNNTTVCKLFTLRILTWNYNCFERIITISYLKV